MVQFKLPNPLFSAVFCQAKEALWPSEKGPSCLSVRMELIKARADAHAVMPGERKSPPNEGAENCLPQGKRKDVALFAEQPGHQGAANQSERDEDRIGPMKQGKKRAGDERDGNWAGDGGEETIGNERI